MEWINGIWDLAERNQVMHRLASWLATRCLLPVPDNWCKVRGLVCWWRCRHRCGLHLDQPQLVVRVACGETVVEVDGAGTGVGYCCSRVA